MHMMLFWTTFLRAFITVIILWKDDIIVMTSYWCTTPTTSDATNRRYRIRLLKALKDSCNVLNMLTFNVNLGSYLCPLLLSISIVDRTEHPLNLIG